MKKAFLLLTLFLIFSILHARLGNLYPATDAEQKMIEDLRDGNLDSFKLEEAALVASEIPSPKINDYILKINNICNEIQLRAGRENEKRLAKAAFKYLRSETLKKYSWSSSSLSDILDSGTFNCVTATLLYNIICSKLGLKVTAIEVPFHTFSRVYIDDKAIDVELLEPKGFNIHRNMDAFRQMVLSYKMKTRQEIAEEGLNSVFDEFYNLKEIPSHMLIHFLYANDMFLKIKDKDYKNAALKLIRILEINKDYELKDLIGCHVFNSWINSEEIKGDHLSAIEAAKIGMKHFPDSEDFESSFEKNVCKAIDNPREYNEKLRPLKKTLQEFKGEEAGDLLYKCFYPQLKESSQQYKFEEAYNLAKHLYDDFPNSSNIRKGFSFYCESFALEQAKSGKYKEAEILLKKSMEADPSNDSAYHNLMSIYSKNVMELHLSGKDNEAFQLIKNAIQEYPSEPVLKFNLISVSNSLAMSFIRNNKFLDAIDILEEALQLVPGNPELKHTLGLCEERAKKLNLKRQKKP